MRLSIDPGVCSGYALFDDSHTLVACGITPIPDYAGVTDLAIERPQVYPQSPVPPNDLITLAIQVGRYVEHYEAKRASHVTILPHRWKGTLPKDICDRRIRQRLLPAELRLVEKAELTMPSSKAHNMLDAIGIGLFAFRGVRL